MLQTAQISLDLAEIPLRGRQPLLNRLFVEQKKGIPLLDVRPFNKKNFFHRRLHPRSDLHRGRGVGLADRFVNHRHIALERSSHFDDGRPHNECGRLGAVATGDQQQAGHGEKSRCGQVQSFNDHADMSIVAGLVARWRTPSCGPRPQEGAGLGR